MKNICKNLIALSVMLVAVTCTANAQSNNKTEKAPAAKQEAAQQVPAEKFFNVQSLDDLKNTIDARYDTYQHATAENHDALHIEYLKAKRLYTVELEKQMPSYSKESAMGQKIRDELKRIRMAE